MGPSQSHGARPRPRFDPGYGSFSVLFADLVDEPTFCEDHQIIRNCFLPALGPFSVPTYPWKSILRRYTAGAIREHYQNIVYPGSTAFTRSDIKARSFNPAGSLFKLIRHSADLRPEVGRTGAHLDTGHFSPLSGGVIGSVGSDRKPATNPAPDPSRRELRVCGAHTGVSPKTSGAPWILGLGLRLHTCHRHGI